MSTVLVTGGTGFIGSHAILQLLNTGHQVRTTVRDLKRAPDVRAMLRQDGVEPGNHLDFVATDLLSDDGWDQAVAGCDYVLHVASPLPFGNPKHEDDLIIPAREGTLRVLLAARNAGVKRVVLTSSFAAISYGHTPRKEPFTEGDWTNLDGPGVHAYVKSKTLAERVAWDFIANHGGDLELTVINPTAVFGPGLSRDLAASLTLFKRLMDGSMPAAPRISFAMADVRDVADLHIRAMTSPAARGERFIAAAGEPLSLHEIAKILRARLGGSAVNVPRFQMPDWLMRLVALRDPAARVALPQLGVVRRASSEKARRLLGWHPRTNEETIIATAESLIQLGIVPG